MKARLSVGALTRSDADRRNSLKFKDLLLYVAGLNTRRERLHQSYNHIPLGSEGGGVVPLLARYDGQGASRWAS